MTTLTLKSYQQAALHSVVALESAGRYQPRKRCEMVNFEGLSFRLSLLNFFELTEKLTENSVQNLIFLNDINDLELVNQRLIFLPNPVLQNK